MLKVLHGLVEHGVRAENAVGAFILRVDGLESLALLIEELVCLNNAWENFFCESSHLRIIIIFFTKFAVELDGEEVALGIQHNLALIHRLFNMGQHSKD